MRSLLMLFVLATELAAQPRPRGRDLGIPFPGRTGPNNAITDVPGVAVGHATIIRGSGKLVPREGPVRTGVTAILPRPRGDWDFVMAATFNQNGNGDMTGTNWVKESGFLEGPILLTGTHSVGTVRDAAIQWQIARGRNFLFSYPLVAETFDFLNDANGEHVKSEHVWAALDSARSGPVVEGGVGGGTGMGCNGFKGGIGTSSRVVRVDSTNSFTLGVLVQCNYFGDLHILGAPVGREITDLSICTTLEGPLSRPWSRGFRRCATGGGGGGGEGGTGLPRNDDASLDGPVPEPTTGRGSIIVIVATDAPFLPHQLERIARRVGMGLGRLGSWAANGSGDLFLAFSTANREDSRAAGYAGGVAPIATIKMLENDRIDGFFRATIEATEEAVVNAMLAAETVTGADGIRAYGLPGDRVVAALRKYGRMP